MDFEVQETEVSRLDLETAPLALALVGVVNVQAVMRPAIRKAPASVRGASARAPRSRRRFGPPLFRISDSNWQPYDPFAAQSTVLPLLILQELKLMYKRYHSGSNGHRSQRAARRTVGRAAPRSRTFFRSNGALAKSRNCPRFGRERTVFS